MERRKNKNTNINDIEPEHICIRVATAASRQFLKIYVVPAVELFYIHHSLAGQDLQSADGLATETVLAATASRTPAIQMTSPVPSARSLCGQVCGKKLKCGFHTCEKLCHRPGECEDAKVSEAHCRQQCGKIRQSCGHVCTDSCHAPFPCKEDKPCQSKAILLCACQNRKQETKCQATFDNPDPIRKTLECDEICLRLQRNQKLAEALHIDPAAHTDDHIPFSTETFKRYASNPSWSQEMEKEFRVFAADAQLKRKRFTPMPSHRRAFLHSLAEDFGFDTLSEDPEPYRHVSVFKTPKFVGAPMKTLSQALKIRNAKLKPGAAARTDEVSTTASVRQEPFNALLLTGPRFGLTVKELNDILRPDLKKFESEVDFSTSFLPGDEIVIKFSSSGVSSTPWRMTDVGKVLSEIKPVVERTAVSTFKVVEAVTLCVVDASGSIERKEQGGVGTWNTVVSRAAKRGGGSTSGTPRTASPAAPAGRAGGGGWGSVGGSGFAGMSSVPSTMPTRSTGFVALKLKKKEEKKPQEPVAESRDNTAAESSSAADGNEYEGAENLNWVSAALGSNAGPS
ncbi:nf-x1 type zinc finger [Zalerion maritima]|uniref:Nf-x1 type zinc finger n=1 Tax=Zalerion maritima TaxID=339359 RepID=A0AAD5RR10_9PEZI|nr:nf-x1 type zinc finger [Zalerion maritima]